MEKQTFSKTSQIFWTKEERTCGIQRQTFSQFVGERKKERKKKGTEIGWRQKCNPLFILNLCAHTTKKENPSK